MARRGRKPKKAVRWEQNKGIVKSALALGLMVAGVVSLLSIFAGFLGSGGKVNSRLQNILVDWFGLPSFLLAIVLFYGGLVSIGTFNFKFIRKRILAGLFLLFISTIGLFGGAGGTVGEFVKAKTAGVISAPGAVFFYLCAFVFSIVLITNTGIHVFIDKLAAFVLFIKVKVLRIEPAPAEGEIEDGEEPQAEFELPAPAQEAGDDSGFKVFSPPSGPVGEDVETAAEASAAGETDQDFDDKSPHADQTSLSRLPFTNKVWEYPPLDLLNNASNKPPDAGDVEGRARTIADTLRAFGIKVDIADINIGPAVAQYALNLAIGTKASKIANHQTDLALRLKSPSGSVRIVAPIPGTNLVGIEVPNFSTSIVTMRSVLESEEMKRSKKKLLIPIGHDVAGKTIVQDIGRWPHALVAGATGSGKSVMLNTLITTLLFRCSPAECRFIMVDPKLVELSKFNGIPHLLTPVVTDIEQKAVSAFAWAFTEMERRYKLFANAGVKDLDSYNKLSGFQAEPYIIIVVDELADMMMAAAQEVERYVIRLAQKSRATGIHLILATQRPSVNILTGTIKANIPTRIAFKVTSQVDSRVIIDQTGADTLIGRGDMLFVPPDDSKAVRIQAPFVSDEETARLVDFLKNTGMEPDYKEEVLQQKISVKGGFGAVSDLSTSDDKMMSALELVLAEGKASTSYLQRKIGLGYARAAKIIDEMEDAGIVGPAKGSKPRDVLVSGMDQAIARLSGEEGKEE